MVEKNNTPGLTSKKKLVMQKSSFFHAPRSAHNISSDSSFLRSDIAQESHSARWFSESASGADEYEKCDSVRVVLGKNWDYRSEDPANPDEKVFSNNWDLPKVFYGSPIKLEFCGDMEIVEDEDIETLNDLAESEKIVLSCDVSGLLTHFLPAKLENWLYYMKTGARLETGVRYFPIIKSGYRFYDHYHKAINPFTPSELETMQPIGKAFYADYKTYYNERSRANQSVSSDFESFTGQNPNIQNSIPSIYSFLKLMLNPQLVENNHIKFDHIVAELLPYLLLPQSNVYTHILKKYPFEAAVLLYGIVGHTWFGSFAGSRIVEKIISSNFDKIDADSLFSDFYREFTFHLQNQENLQFLLGEQKNNLRALERKLYNLVFSPESTKFLSKVDQYKKYFPFYAELEFTADIFTSIGDSMKQLYMTKFISDCILSRHTVSPDKTAGDSFGGAAYGNRFEISPPYNNIDNEDGTSYINDAFGKAGYFRYVNYYESKTFADIGGMSLEQSEGSIVEYQDYVVDVDNILKAWLNPADSYFLKEGAPAGSMLSVDNIEGVHLGPQKPANNQDFQIGDLRNYTSYFTDEMSEPVNINSDDNVIFKKLFGAAFQAKILEIYKKHKRSYSDILNGVPAYTEDLFYRIEKIRTDPETGENKVVQNILIPNTSDLNLVKYVDTQLKYHTYATYTYNVYAHRIVFGSKYQYSWLDPSTNQPYPQSKQKSFWSDSNAADFVENPTSPIEDIVEQINTLGAGLAIDTTESGSPSMPTEGEPPGNTADPMGFADGAMPVLENEDVPPITEPPDALMVHGGQTAVESSKLTAAFRVKVSPSIKIISDKIFSTPEILIMDKPPVPPDINIIPYRAINNRIKILLTGASDRYRMEPVMMLESDQEEFAKVATAQLSTDGKIEFGSDDPVTSFQIFRTQKKPITYKDFELYDQTNKQHYEEEILPNTKYYYTFRAIDSHGHVSNPTHVYEVELIDEKGAVKPIIRLFDMTPPSNKTLSKECQKYIYIKPNLQQLYFSDNPNIDSIFSNQNTKKKYKMRITSKGSGKKVDVNFSFKKNLQTD